MPVDFDLSELEALRLDLLKLPEDLADKAQGRIVQAVRLSSSRIQISYPRGQSGDLAGKVKISVERNGPSVVGIVKNTSKIGYIFENGSANRYTDKGAFRGAMPPGHVFIPIVAQERRKMYADLKEIVAEAGLEVSGDA